MARKRCAESMLHEGAYYPWMSRTFDPNHYNQDRFISKKSLLGVPFEMNQDLGNPSAIIGPLVNALVRVNQGIKVRRTR